MKYTPLLFLASLLIAKSAFSADPVTLGLEAFTDEKGGKPSAAWVVEADGAIHRTDKAGSLISAKEYSNFELEWEWKVAEAGNSGVKYWVNTFPKGGWLGIEYQMIDDERHPDAKKASHTAGAIYDIKAPVADKGVKPAGEWNKSKIVANNGKIQHFLNGKLSAEADVSTAEWKELLSKSKFKAVEGFAPGKGRFLLQDHNDEVWFKNITVKEL